MNALETYLQKTGASEVAALNALQGNGVVSDLCVSARDVAEVDCQRSVEFLEAKP